MARTIKISERVAAGLSVDLTPVEGVDRPGEGVVAEQRHGAEIGYDVEADQQRRGDHGGAKLRAG